MDAYAGFRDFVSGHGSALMAMAYALTGDRHRAEDLVQTVLAKLAVRWERHDHPRDPEAYAKTALYREFCSWWRVRRHHEIPRDDLPEVRHTPDFTDLSDARIVLAKALLQLPAKQRVFVVLRYYEDRSEAETSAIVGCAVGTVKSQTHKALRRLRVLVPDLEVGRSEAPWSM